MSLPSDPLFPDRMPLVEARDKLRGLVDEGYRCPCCTQFAKVYRRIIHASMAVALIRIYRAQPRPGGDFVGIAGILEHRQVADAAKLVYWHLIEEEPSVRADGGRAGYWRITERGVEFALGRERLPKHARVYDGRLLNLVSDETVTITDCLGKRFDYRELMEGA